MSTLISLSHRLSIILSLFTVMLLLLSCDSEETTIPEDKNEDAVVTAVINGEKFASTEVFFSETTARFALNLDQQPDDYRLDIDSESNVNNIEKRFSLSLFARDGNTLANLKAGDTFTAVTQSLEFSANYNIKDRNEENSLSILTVSKRSVSTSCTITKINREEQLISGTFTFDAESFSPNDGEIYEIRDGVFTDIKYTVRN